MSPVPASIAGLFFHSILQMQQHQDREAGSSGAAAVGAMSGDDGPAEAFVGDEQQPLRHSDGCLVPEAGPGQAGRGSRRRPDQRVSGGTECQDPFTNIIEMSRADWVMLALGTVFLLPFRALGVGALLVLAWVLSKVGMLGMSDEEIDSMAEGRRGWRRRLMSIFSLISYLIFVCAGFRVKVVGRQAGREEAPILVGAPHSSFLESLIIFMCRSSPVSRLESKDAFLVSAIQRFFQSVFVDRRTPESRQMAKDVIKGRALSGDMELPQLFLCPEGTNTNRKVLIQFKLGGFYPGVPVQPVLIRYPGHERVDAVTWTYRQSHTYLFSICYLLASPVNRVEVEFLPVYRPSANEIRDPELYAKNVQLLMADRLGLVATDIAYTKNYQEYLIKHKLIPPGAPPEFGRRTSKVKVS